MIILWLQMDVKLIIFVSIYCVTFKLTQMKSQVLVYTAILRSKMIILWLQMYVKLIIFVSIYCVTLKMTQMKPQVVS